jgi:hypothetical protein
MTQGNRRRHIRQEPAVQSSKDTAMQSDPEPCHHQLERPPDLVTDVGGISYLLFECILCGCGISLRLDADGQIDAEFIIPPARKRA